MVSFREKLGNEGWGFLTMQPDGGPVGLVIDETEPPLPPGWMLWLAKDIPGGRILRGAVFFSLQDTPEDVERRAWLVLSALRRTEMSDRAAWN